MTRAPCARSSRASESPTAAARALTMTSGPVGLADTNSRRMRAPASASPCPYDSPAARMSDSARAVHSADRNTLMNPGPATSSRATSGSAGKLATIASAICRGARLAARASVIAVFVA